MTDEAWPDAALPYRYPVAIPDNEEKWASAIDTSLAAGTLVLVQTAPSSDVYELTGDCPRCGHQMSQTIEFEVIVGVAPVSGKVGIFNIQRECLETQLGRDDDHAGCGWGGALNVPFSTR